MTVFNDWVFPEDRASMPDPSDSNPVCKLCGHKATPHHHFAEPIICLLCPNGLCQDGLAGEAYRSLLTAG